MEKIRRLDFTASPVSLMEGFQERACFETLKETYTVLLPSHPETVGGQCFA